MKKLLLLATILITSNAFAAEKNIVETAMANPQFSTLVSLVKQAGLVETLSSKGPFTLFAPTNEAFSKLSPAALAELKSDKQKLSDVLTYHVVSGKVPASQVVNMSEAKTVEGAEISISKTANNKVKIDDATVTATDTMTSNGIIHTIDTVLMPQAQ